VLALLYAAGERPAVMDLRRAAEASGGFAVTFAPEGEPGRAEVLITGLAFELSGLAPGEGEPIPAIAHRFGFEDSLPDTGWEAIVLRPGPHLAGAAAMLPVVRGCVALAAALAKETHAGAVAWLPARSAMGSDYFAAVVADWLNGGAFPVLGLTALVRGGSGFASEGLAFFTGQELDLIASPGGEPAQTGRIAIRLIDLLAAHGPVTAPIQLAGPDGEPLLAEPMIDGSRVRVELRA
jgi:hypothetical protein